MLRNGVKIILFLSSYIPLFVIIMIRNYDKTDLLIALGAIIVTVLVILSVVFWRIRLQSGEFKKIERIENINRVGLEYFITYIIPFLAIDFLNIKDVASILIIFGVMGIIYMKSDLIYMNPILNLAGFNLYKIISNGEEFVIISKNKKNQLLPSEEVIEIADHVLIGLSDRVNTNSRIS